MASCKSVGSVVEKIWKKHGETLTSVQTGNPYITAAQAALKATDKVIKGWNQLIKDPSLKIGPRRWDPNKKLTGTLASLGDRTFVSAPLQCKEATVTIEKLDYKGKAEIAVCSYDKNNRHKKLFEYTFDRGKCNIGKEVTRKLSGVKNKVLVAVFDGKSPTDRFKYSVKLKVDQPKETSASTKTGRSSHSRRTHPQTASGSGFSRAVSGATRAVNSFTSGNRNSRRKSNPTKTISRVGRTVSSLIKR